MDVLEDRLTALPSINLNRGAHDEFEDGHCAMEVVAWLAGEGHTAAPECASDVLRVFTVIVNDSWSDAHRQNLVPLLPRMIGTAGDNKDRARKILAADWLVRTCAPMFLDLAMFKDEANALRDLEQIVNPSSTDRVEVALLNLQFKLNELQPTISYSANLSGTAAIRLTGVLAAMEIQSRDSAMRSFARITALALEISCQAARVATQMQFDSDNSSPSVPTPTMETIAAVENSLLELLDSMIDPA